MTTTQIKARKGDFITWQMAIGMWRVGVVLSVRNGEARGVAEPGRPPVVLRPGTLQAVASPARLTLPPRQVAAKLATHKFKAFEDVFVALAEFATEEPSA